MNNNGTNGTLAANKKKIDRFLDKLKNSGNVRAACRAAGVPRRTVYNWRDKWITFREDWDEAIDEACDLLEGKAWQRAIYGNSDRMLMFLLKAHRPDKYKERQHLEHTGADGEPMAVTLVEVVRSGE